MTPDDLKCDPITLAAHAYSYWNENGDVEKAVRVCHNMNGGVT